MKVLALLLLSVPAFAATVYVPSKLYSWEWGAAKWDFEAGTDELRGWLEPKPVPKLLDAPKELRRATIRYHELGKTVAVKYAVLGPPRSTGGHDPYFFAWIEWVSRSEFAFDLDEKRVERKAGIARVVLEGKGETHPDIREWHWEKDLTDKDLGELLPWDAGVIARKMVSYHRHRPRVLPEKANGPGKHAPY